jgi:glutathione S-transferase
MSAWDGVEPVSPPRHFANVESTAPADGWLAGAGFSIGDIAVASVIRTLAYAGVEPDPAQHPRLIAWYDRVKARPAWQAVAEAEAMALAGNA